MKRTKEEMIEAVKKNASFSDALRSIEVCVNTNNLKKIKNIAVEYNIDISHFDLQWKNRKYKIEQVECVICNKKYKVQIGHPKQKTVCSKACSNTLYRSGKNNPNYNPDKNRYRDICFKYWSKKCAICGWNKIIDAHHIDRNNKNNDPKNLFPICANHHRMTVAKKYRKNIDIQIQKINAKFWETLKENNTNPI